MNDTPLNLSSDDRRSEVKRRQFIKTVGGVAAASSLGSLPIIGWANEEKSKKKKTKKKTAENYVHYLYDSLTEKQREKICFDFDHKLSKKVANNWHIVPQRIGDFLNSDQQELVRKILQGITSEDGYERFMKQMKDDDGGLNRYSCALFGDPEKKKCQFVLTGRHTTLRADGNSVANQALGGPIFYGHAVSETERPDHKGNVWWHQARAANKLYKALDGKQQEKALLSGRAPADSASTVKFKANPDAIPGLAGSDLSKDQMKLLEETLKGLVNMFRKEDVEEVMTCLKKNGGLEKAKISYYKQMDLGKDGIWDRWKVEGPAFIWYFRGSPHVHTWVNIAHKGRTEV